MMLVARAACLNHGRNAWPIQALVLPRHQVLSTRCCHGQDVRQLHPTRKVEGPGGSGAVTVVVKLVVKSGCLVVH